MQPIDVTEQIAAHHLCPLASSAQEAIAGVSQESCQAGFLFDSGCTVKAHTIKFFKKKQAPPFPLIESMLTTENYISIWCLQSTLYCKLKD